MRTADDPGERSIEQRVAELLLEREARGLRWSSGARTACLAIGLAVEAANAESLLNWLLLVSFISGGMLLFLAIARATRRAQKRPSELLLLGRLGVAFDIAFLLLMPIVWYLAVGGTRTNAIFLVRNDQALLMIVFITFNTLVLRPGYPLAIAAAGVLQLAAFAVYASFDPRAQLTDSNLVAVLGDAVKPGFYGWRIAAVIFCGVFLSQLARWGRRTVRDAVALEGTTLRLAEKQMEAIRQAKNEATASLVAGFAHELNTPLGALQSAASTATLAGRRLHESVLAAGSIEEVRQAKTFARAARALDETEAEARAAGERLKAVIDALKDYSQLDRPDKSAVDLAAALSDAVGLVHPALRGEVEVDLELVALPPLEVHVSAFNQVFMTLIENALEALGGKGRLTLRSALIDDGGAIALEVIDDGPGIDAEQLPHLFDLGFAAKRGRIGVGFSLPAARRTVEQHGGTLRVETERGRGTRFSITLPRRP